MVVAISRSNRASAGTEFALAQLGYPYSLDNPNFDPDEVMAIHVLVERVAIAFGLHSYKFLLVHLVFAAMVTRLLGCTMEDACYMLLRAPKEFYRMESEDSDSE